MDFVGRARELDLLRIGWEAVAEQRPRFVLIEGVGGSGKTALTRAFTAQLGGATVVRITGDEDETAVPYGLLDQLWGPPPMERARDPVVEGLALLRWLAEQPLVLLIDDAHLADGPSLRAITFALRRLRTEQVLTVVVSRPDGVIRLPSGLVRLIDDSGTRIVLGGMSRSEVQMLAAATGFGHLTERGAERLRDHTQGNPLHLRTMLADLTPAQVESAATPLPAPRSLALQVVGTMAQARPTARRLAAAAAVLGSGTRLSDAAVLGDVADPLAAVQELQQAAIADLAEDRIVFAHPLVRAAVYGNLGASTRAELHMAAAALCSGRAALRHRVAATAGPHPGLVDALVEQSHADRQGGAWRLAADALLSAMTFSKPGLGRNRLLLDAIELLLLDGDLTTAAAYAAQVAELPEDAHRLQVQARIAWLSGDHGLADAYARAAWTSAGNLDPRTRDDVAAMLSMMCILRSDGTGAAQWATRALESGLLSSGTAATTRAAGAIGLALIGRARDGFDMLGNASGDDMSPELAARGMLKLWTDDLAGAEADLRASQPSPGHGPGIGMGPYRLTALGYLIETHYRRGDWTSASALAEQAVALVEDTGQAWLAAFVHALAVLVPAARGQWEVAEQHLATAQAAAVDLSDGPSRAYAANAAVHLAACRDDTDHVLAQAQWLLSDERGPNHEPGFLGWSVLHASALVKAGRLEDAAERLAELQVIAEARGRRSRLAALARVRGELAAARKATGEARSAFDDAMRLGAGVSDALEAAVAEETYGRFLRRRGERRAAIVRLNRARQLFTELGAQPFQRRCERELEACGVKAEARVDQPLLTPQEAAVAELVCAGRTNRQVAEDLVLSVKTISYHLAHVYAKFGVTSRMQLAAAMGVSRT